MSRLSSINVDLILVTISAKPEKTRSDSTLAVGIKFKSWKHLSRFGPRFPSISKFISYFIITLVISFLIHVFSISWALISSFIGQSSFLVDLIPSETSISTSNSDVIFSGSLTRLATIEIIVVLFIRPKFKSGSKLSSA